MPNYKTILLILIASFVSIKVNCQNKIPTEWIQSLSQYRDLLLRKNIHAAYELNALLDKWDSLGFSEEEQTKLTFNVLHLSAIYNSRYKHIKKKVKKMMPNPKFAQTFAEGDLATITKNAELLDMIFLGLLQAKYPFKIDPKTNLFQELLAYNISDNDNIAEIGAGAGAFSFILNQIEPTVNLHINELDNYFLEYIKTRLENNREMYNLKNIELVRGQKKSINLEGYELDKIIIRNSFHHFGKKSDMLDSIKKSMKNEGELYIIESTLELNKENDSCKKAMSRDDLVSIIESNGFKLVREIPFEYKVLLKFIIN